MNCFMLKAISTNQEWFKFSIKDAPTPISDDTFVLLRKPNSPILYLNGIRRGDPKTGLFEGDVIEYDNELYLICYERGFYAINRDYVTCLFDKLTDYKLIGTMEDVDLGVPISLKKTLLFKYKNTVFKINDIVGASADGLLINSLSEAINPELIKQDCCLIHNKQRVYLGDIINGFPVQLVNGQLKVKASNGEFTTI